MRSMRLLDHALGKISHHFDESQEHEWPHKMSDTMPVARTAVAVEAGHAGSPKYVRKVDKLRPRLRHRQAEDAVARVWIKPGAARSSSTPRGRKPFRRPVLRMLIQHRWSPPPVRASTTLICTVTGGVYRAKAGAGRHGISKALTYSNRILARRSQEGRFPHPRPVPSSGKEVRPAKARKSFPVLETLKFAANCCGSRKGRPPGALFHSGLLLRIYRAVTQFFSKTCGCVQTHSNRAVVDCIPVTACRSRLQPSKMLHHDRGRPMSSIPPRFTSSPPWRGQLGAMLLLSAKQETSGLKWGKRYLLARLGRYLDRSPAARSTKCCRWR